MSLRGNLSDFSVLETLQLIGLQRKGGTLEIVSGKERRELHFVDGALIGCRATCESDPDPFLETLVGLGRIEAFEARRIRAGALRLNRDLLDCLLEETRLTPETLLAAHRLALQGCLDRVLLWNRGRFVFHPGAPQTGSIEAWNTEQALLETMRRLDEAAALRSGEIGPETIPMPVGPEESLPSSEEIDPEESPGLERAFLARMDGRRSLREVGSLLGVADYDLFVTARSLHDRGRIRLVSARVREGDAPPLIRRARSRGPTYIALLLPVGLLLGGIGLQVHRWTRDLMRPSQEASLRRRSDLEREEAVRLAVEVYRNREGRYPVGLRDLIDERIWPEERSRDLEIFTYTPSSRGNYELSLRSEP